MNPLFIFLGLKRHETRVTWDKVKFQYCTIDVTEFFFLIKLQQIGLYGTVENYIFIMGVIWVRVRWRYIGYCILSIQETDCYQSQFYGEFASTIERNRNAYTNIYGDITESVVVSRSVNHMSLLLAMSHSCFLGKSRRRYFYNVILLPYALHHE